MDRLGAYEGRTDKYLNCFRRYIEDAGVVIDVGCGPGIFSRALANKRRLIIALDIEEENLRKIKDLDVEKVHADAQNMPFRKGSIDYVLSLTNGAPPRSRKTRQGVTLYNEKTWITHPPAPKPTVPLRAP